MRRLLIRPGAIGDVILSLPALEFLQVAYSEVWVPAPLVPLIGFADRVRPLSSTGIELLGVGDLQPSPELSSSLKTFDQIVCWYGANRPEFRAALCNINSRAIFHPALPPKDSTLHATDFFSSQVGGPEQLAGMVRIVAPQYTKRRVIAIHPFSGSALKNWPLSAFRQLAAELPLPVEWIAGPEQTLSEAQRFDDLGELAKSLSAATLYIGNDSGITHLAAAVGLPVIALFGPSDPNVWAPRGPRVELLHHQPLADLPVASVLAAVNRLLC